MDQLRQKFVEVFAQNQFCYLATSNNKNVDNATVGYYSEDLNLYFVSYADTLKCRYIKVNPQVAGCIANTRATGGVIQLHGIVKLIEYGSQEYQVYKEKYLGKFPNFKSFLEIEHELYRIEPLVIWQYKGSEHRDKIIIDKEYYQRIKPYETNPYFDNMKGYQ